jgi:hypothetical protein
MILKLHKLHIRLHSEDTAVNREWHTLLAGWLLPDDPAANVDMSLNIQLVAVLPPLPSTPPLFTDRRTLPDDVGILTVYGDANGRVWLHYHDGALLSLPLSETTDTPTIAGYVTPKALAYGRFEDITFTTLAPFLRRRGYYLIHAFAASKDGRATLIVGPSGSGKTTTGLNLLLQGWQLLANDILLLEKRDGLVFALPTPGGVNIRAQTWALLPQLHTFLPQSHQTDGKINLSGHELTGGQWAEPTIAGLILFPQVTARPCSEAHCLNRAVALVRLLEESADRWDETTLAGHVDLLQLLSRQTAVYDLQLGQDVNHLPNLVEKLAANRS